jgi:hypothetical protein
VSDLRAFKEACRVPISSGVDLDRVWRMSYELANEKKNRFYVSALFVNRLVVELGVKIGWQMLPPKR